MRGGLKALALSALAALGLSFLPSPVWAASGAVHTVDTSEAFARALQDIKDDGDTDATIELSADVMLADPFTGVAGEHVTVRSEQGGGTHLLSWPSGAETVKLSGSLTLERVHVSPKTFYANGHHLTLGEGFGGGVNGDRRMIVYGGSDRDLTANTRVTILDGVYKLIAGGNSAGTLTGDTLVEFGGSARFPNASDGADADPAYTDGTLPGQGDPKGGDRRVVEKSEHYNLYFNSIVVSEFNPVMVTVYKQGCLAYGIYGGGIGGNVTGNTNVTMTGGEVYQIFGGGAAVKAPSIIGNNLGKVGGDTHVSVTGGEVKSVYGGGFNDLQSLLDNSDVTGEEAVATDALRDTRAAVAGSTNVTIAGSAHVPEANRPQWTTSGSYDLPGIYGGSFHSSVKDTHVTVGGDAVVETRIGSQNDYGALWGGGCSDKVRGTTHVELTGNARIGNDSNGEVNPDGAKGGTVTPLGRSADTKSYFGGIPFSYGAEVLNQDGKEYAATAIISGGRADVLTASHKRTPKVENTTTVHGSAHLVQTGGVLQTIEAGCRGDKGVSIIPAAGRSPVDVTVSGGSVSRYIMGRYPSNSNIDHAELTFNPCGTEASYLEVPNMIYLDSVTIEGGAHIAAKPAFAQGPIKKTPFTEVGCLSIEKDGFLALSDNASITKDLALNGSLHLVKKRDFILAKPRTLTAAGTASGTGELRIVAQPSSGADYSQFKTPESGEECVYATAAGSDMSLGLANPEPQLFVDRKHHDDTQDVWFINKQVPQDVTVTFDKNGGDTDADPANITVKSGSTVGELPGEPTRTNHTFLGWNTQADGSGEAFTATTPVTGNITVYAQWQEIPEQLWCYEVYYQFYEADGDQHDENGASYSWVRQTHGQGGWAHPDDTVRIDKTKFDGLDLGWDAIDGSGPETLGVHYVYDENYGPHRLSATCSEAGKDNPLKIYYRAAPHTLSYEYEGEVPDGAPQAPATVSSSYGATVEVTGAPSMDGWKFSGWTVKSPAGASIAEDGTLAMPNTDVVLSGSWTRTTTPVIPTSAVYKVEHYQQQLDGSYQLADTDFPLYGKIDTQVSATPKGYSRHHLNTERSLLTGTVFKPYEQDGKPVYLVLKAYYDLDRLTLNYDLNGGVGADGIDYAKQTLPAGTKVTVNAAPSLDGHIFLGWDAGSVTYQPGDTFELAVDTVLTAQWKKSEPTVPPVDPTPEPEPEPQPDPKPEPQPEHEAEHEAEQKPDQTHGGNKAPELPKTGDPLFAVAALSGAMGSLSLALGTRRRKRP